MEVDLELELELIFFFDSSASSFNCLAIYAQINHKRPSNIYGRFGQIDGDPGCLKNLILTPVIGRKNSPISPYVNKQNK